MKILGIIFLVLAVLNLLVALFAMSSGAPSEAITMKFNAFVLLAVLGYALERKTKQILNSIRLIRPIRRTKGQSGSF